MSFSFDVVKGQSEPVPETLPRHYSHTLEFQAIVSFNRTTMGQRQDAKDGDEAMNRKKEVFSHTAALLGENQAKNCNNHSWRRSGSGVFFS
ncbi:MAG: hypothetical protein K2O70_05240 [Desulfovibrionaceae bacterium]|nr:hypothetical protein [Desulfovibrionaceae bacterium]